MLRSKYVFVVIALLALAMGLYGVYYWGYSDASAKYEAILEKQSAQIKELESRESAIETVVVTEYKDRVKRVEVVKEKIVEVIRNDGLSQESDNCRIGDVFISLHNAAASQDLPKAPFRVNGAAGGSKNSEE